MGVLATIVKTHDIESLIDYLSGGTGAQTCLAAHGGVSEVSLPVIGVNVMDVAIEAVLKEPSPIASPPSSPSPSSPTTHAQSTIYMGYEVLKVCWILDRLLNHVSKGYHGARRNTSSRFSQFYGVLLTS